MSALGMFPFARRWLVVLQRRWVYPGAGSGRGRAPARRDAPMLPRRSA